MMQIPGNSVEMFQEINDYVLDLPQPIIQLFLLDIYDLYANHKIAHMKSTIIAEYERSIDQESE